MASLWYLTVDGVRHGPMSAEELRSWARGGRLKPTDYLWKEGLAEWQLAGAVEGLFESRNKDPEITLGRILPEPLKGHGITQCPGCSRPGDPGARGVARRASRSRPTASVGTRSMITSIHRSGAAAGG